MEQGLYFCNQPFMSWDIEECKLCTAKRNGVGQEVVVCFLTELKAMRPVIHRSCDENLH